MAKDLRERHDRDDNKKRGSSGNDVIGKFQPLPRRVWDLRTRHLCLRLLQRCFELRNLQLRHGDRRNCGQGNRQRRNGLSGGGSGGYRVEARCNFGNSPSAPGIAAEGMPRDVEKRLGKRIRNDRIRLVPRLQCAWALRERFDQSHAQGPDVRSCGQRRSGCFGRVVSVEFAR